MYPGFSERTFEFCFNAEYCRLNAALLASHPHIPSQQLEKDLGYDVEFKLKSGTHTRSLFLQHKVASYAEAKAGRNGKFFDAHGGPYYRFPVDNDQHNVLCALSASKGNTFYCSPRFHRRHQLEHCFQSSTVGGESLLLNPLDVGTIADTVRHNITYGPLGTKPTLHSEPRPFDKAFSGDRERGPQLAQNNFDLIDFNRLSRDLMKQAKGSQVSRALTADLDGATSIQRLQILLGRVYQVTWLLLP